MLFDIWQKFRIRFCYSQFDKKKMCKIWWKTFHLFKINIFFLCEVIGHVVIIKTNIVIWQKFISFSVLDFAMLLDKVALVLNLDKAHNMRWKPVINQESEWQFTSLHSQQTGKSPSLPTGTFIGATSGYVALVNDRGNRKRKDVEQKLIYWPPYLLKVKP